MPKLSHICPALSEEDQAIMRDRVGVRTAAALMYERMARREWQAISKKQA